MAELRDRFEAGDAAARPPAVARGPVRLLRRVDAVLAVPRPAAHRGSACSPTSPSSACASRCGGRLERLFGDRAARDLPVPRRAARAHARARGREARLAELSPEALQYRTFEVVRELLARLAEDGPAGRRARGPALGGRRPRSSCSSGCSRDTEDAALLLVLDDPARARPPVVAREGGRGPRAPAPDHARSRSRRCRATPAASCSTRSSARARCPTRWSAGSSSPAEGNPFFLEELVRSLVDAGALVRERARAGGSTTTVDGRGPADRREGDPRADRPARRPARATR